MSRAGQHGIIHFLDKILTEPVFKELIDINIFNILNMSYADENFNNHRPSSKFNNRRACRNNSSSGNNDNGRSGDNDSDNNLL